MRTIKIDTDSEYLYTTPVKDKHTGFIHNIDVYKVDDGYGFQIDWFPINLKEILENN